MKPRTSIVLHWTLFALALVGAGWIIVLGYLELDAAFARGDLTRQTLFASLTYLGAALALLWVAGWVFVSRPKAPRPDPVDGYAFVS
jgi:hypothetical protein